MNHKTGTLHMDGHIRCESHASLGVHEMCVDLTLGAANVEKLLGNS